ncbi:MAG: meso-butanediol dehydrogenase/(S,S)-butanediol dehydrogenase/diacetyl reductase [Halieaceae bacterium]
MAHRKAAALLNTHVDAFATLETLEMGKRIDERFAKLTGASKGETYKKYVEGIALARAETPDDVAAFVSYLAGPDSDYMTG